MKSGDTLSNRWLNPRSLRPVNSSTSSSYNDSWYYNDVIILKFSLIIGTALTDKSMVSIDLTYGCSVEGRYTSFNASTDLAPVTSPVGLGNGIRTQ